MSRKRLLSMVALFAALSLVAVACGGGDEEEPTPQVKKGGTYRIQTDGFEWTSGFDPTGEYLGFSWMFFSDLLLRTLVSYNHKSAAKGGNEPLLDLATKEEVSSDGLTWTYTIRTGVKYAPPLNREVTTKDIAFAFQRMASTGLAQYPSYYEGTIEGFAVQAKKPEDIAISGITTPTDQTIVFKLTRPTGDFRFRLAMPATAPIPPEVAGCFNKAAEYGRFFIASGPYMIEGTDKLDAGSCSSLKSTGPIKGFDPTDHLRIVRNPNYSAATDDPKIRSANIDGVELTLNTNTQDIFDRIKAGQADGESSAPPPAVLQAYSSPRSDRLRDEQGDRTWYISMNMVEPPFDDVHVRKALNWVMDKAGLLRVWGGPIRGRIGEHVIPPEVLFGKLAEGEFDPYGTDGDAGDVNKAKEEMKLSKYDTDKDGLCDAEACKNILHVTRATPPFTEMGPVIAESMKKIGMTIKTQEVESFYGTAGVPKKRVPLASGGGWGKDYADALTFIDPLLGSGAILPEGNVNTSMVGLTPEIAKKVGLAGTESAPGVDADSDGCKPLTGDARNECWANIDKKLMSEIVPWVPYLWATNIDIISDAVVNYEFDQFSGEVSLAHVALDTTKQK